MSLECWKVSDVDENYGWYHDNSLKPFEGDDIEDWDRVSRDDMLEFYRNAFYCKNNFGSPHPRSNHIATIYKKGYYARPYNRCELKLFPAVWESLESYPNPVLEKLCDFYLKNKDKLLGNEIKPKQEWDQYGESHILLKEIKYDHYELKAVIIKREWESCGEYKWMSFMLPRNCNLVVIIPQFKFNNINFGKIMVEEFITLYEKHEAFWEDYNKKAQELRKIKKSGALLAISQIASFCLTPYKSIFTKSSLYNEFEKYKHKRIQQIVREMIHLNRIHGVL